MYSVVLGRRCLMLPAIPCPNKKLNRYRGERKCGTSRQKWLLLCGLNQNWIRKLEQFDLLCSRHRVGLQPPGPNMQLNRCQVKRMSDRHRLRLMKLRARVSLSRLVRLGWKFLRFQGDRRHLRPNRIFGQNRGQHSRGKFQLRGMWRFARLQTMRSKQV